MNRFRVGEEEWDAFRGELVRVSRVLGEQRGSQGCEAGQNADDPELWVLVSRWDGVGSYRRALSAYEVKVGVVPVLSRSIDEPSAYLPVTEEPNRNLPR